MVKSFHATFVLVALIAALSVAPAPANALSRQQGPPARRHNHVAERMIKKVKRQIPIVGGGGSASGSSTAGASTTAATSAATTSAPAETEKPATTAQNTSVTSNTAVTSDTSKATSTVSSTGTTSNTSSRTSASSVASVDPTPTAPPPQTAASNTPTKTPIKGSTVTSVSTASAAASTETPTSSGLSSGTVIALVAVAASIAVIAAIWTVIRKWKFSPSRSFEDRLEPLPPQSGRNSSDVGPAVGAAGARGLERTTSDGSSHRNMYAPDLPPVSMAPDYPSDMYAGGGTYADMQRGNPDPYYRGVTPQPPQMDQIGHQQVYSRGPYDGYDAAPAPFHPSHQDAYGGYTGHQEQEYGAPAGPYRGY